MSGSGADVPDYLREQFARVNAKLDRMQGDLDNLKVRMSAAEAESGHVRIALAEVNSRLDRMDKRLNRIEGRLELTDAEA